MVSVEEGAIIRDSKWNRINRSAWLCGFWDKFCWPRRYHRWDVKICWPDKIHPDTMSVAKRSDRQKRCLTWFGREERWGWQSWWWTFFH